MTNNIRLCIVALMLQACGLCHAGFTSPTPVTSPWSRDFLRSTNAPEAGAKIEVGIDTLTNVNLTGYISLPGNGELLPDGGWYLGGANFFGNGDGSFGQLGGLFYVGANHAIQKVSAITNQGALFTIGPVTATNTQNLFVGNVISVYTAVIPSNQIPAYNTTATNWWIGSYAGALSAICTNNGANTFTIKQFAP